MPQTGQLPPVNTVIAAPAASAPGGSPAQSRSLFKRLTTGLPLLVTIALHIVLGLVAAAIVVQRTSTEKKRIFESAPPTSAVAVKQVEHRLQIARRSGASGAVSSPVSANRIFSSSPSALALPELPDLPSLSTGGFGGFGSAGAGMGLDGAAGLATSLGAGLGGRGFMSLSFLGATTPNPSQMIFVVDTGTSIMAPAKGGFQAFAIIREEIMRLVGRLPPTCRFNVILYRAGSGEDGEGGLELNLFQPTLVVASTEQKKAFFAWMTPVNATLGNFGPGSATRRTPWSRKELPASADLDPLLYPPVWSRAVHAALEQEPTTIFVITSTDGVVRRAVDGSASARRNAEVERSLAAFKAELAKAGLTLEGVSAARNAAYRKAGRQLAEANKKLTAAGKDPIVVTSNQQIFTAAVQAELKRHGITLTLDLTGWSRPDGTPYKIPERNGGALEGATWSDLHSHLAKLQKALLREKSVINLFLFVGPNDEAVRASENLTAVAKRNGGSFQRLTARRLAELQTRPESEK